MNIIVNNGRVLDNFFDYEKVEFAQYPEGSSLKWVPDETQLLVSSDNGVFVPDPRIIMSDADLLNCVRQDIDRKTQELITYGFIFSGVRFPCTLDQQMNFKATYDMRDILTYPFKVKGAGQNFLMLQNATEVASWFLTGFQHVHGCLQVGWDMKDAVASLSHAELIAYVDPRL